ncbi:uncharacterized protein I303_103634 [Kwoniella dejecticola CBS 10117]|uniref:Uncharacterized protein n=1 Tax=Kwoniella dejecticola CBS 10117 TaxID=1296121 RepID=A0A1A6A7A6_9TREE|nr:uncharacterized protein I303_03655 [Kwoniella dejecticola CBS 10117]OBR85940.1 hypothetical protein I303_03655 [Kwoniella dejecticola CBS 10117]
MDSGAKVLQELKKPPDTLLAEDNGSPVECSASPNHQPNFLAAVHYGKFDLKRRRPALFSDGPLQAGFKYVLNQALELARSVVTHPACLPIASTIMSSDANAETQSQVAKGIIEVLANAEIVLVLEEMAPNEAGKYIRVSESSRDFDLNSSTIYLNELLSDLLLQSYNDRTNSPKRYDRMLFHVAMVLSYELIHYMRRPLIQQLAPSAITINDYLSPTGESPTQTQCEHEAGWQFESDIMLGTLDGAWSYEEPEDSSGDESGCSETLSLEEQIRRSIVNASDRRKPYDMLCISRGSPPKIYKVHESWLSGCHRAFRDGKFHTITFPPTVNPEPLNTSDIDIVRIKRDRHRADLIKLKDDEEI